MPRLRGVMQEPREAEAALVLIRLGKGQRLRLHPDKTHLGDCRNGEKVRVPRLRLK